MKTDSKYWADKAAAVVGQKVATFNGRDGVVLPQAGDYTPEMVGAIPIVQKGAAGGVAELDIDGKVTAVQLPAGYVIPYALTYTKRVYGKNRK